MTLTRRTFSGLALAAVATPLVAGCQKKSDSPEAAGSGDSFTYWSMWKEGEDQQKVLAAAFSEFTQETGIKVEVQWSGREVLTQVVPRLNAGNPPDLVDNGNTDVAAKLGLDNVMSLADVFDAEITGEGKKVSDVVPAALMDGLKKPSGEPFMVPYEIIGATTWFNAKVTPELKTAPASWDDFVRVLDQLKAKGRTPIALDGDIKDYCAYWLEWPLLRSGGPGTITNAVKDATFDDATWTQATEAVEKLVKGGYFPAGFQGTKFPTQQASWADQTSKTDVLIMGSWLPSEASASLAKAGKDPKSVEFGSFPFPSFGENKGAGLVEAQSIGFAVPEKARHAGAAKKFAAWFMHKDRLVKIATQAKNLTPRTDVEAPAELKDFAEEYKNAKSTVPFTDGIGVSEPKWVTDIWQPAIGDLFGGKLTASAFRQQLTTKTTDYNKNK